ncbi:SCO family protein [Mesonia maritima]|uniref:Protein SCO1/2 n=1 Tax=Mesonia maritima TaxID=1793873 RepID=A0ABU1K3K1_9FLAO|nr:SCO family protein [Mesonia maritima]MDR6300181.1 protein SCO1/2 [Mesonia maritima]
MKRKYSYIGLGIIILVFGIIVIPKIVERFANNDVVENDRLSEKETTLNTEDELSYIIINGEPKKVPSFKFVDQHNDTITNESYKGRVYVAEFFFTTCPTICPKMNENMSDIQQVFKGNTNFGIASFSINPSYDTPEILKEYAEKYNITNPHWHLLTGNQDEIFELANNGFNFYVASNLKVEGNFQHSGYFALVDQEGFIRSRKDQFGNPIIFYNGLEDDDLKMLKEDIKKLLK